MRPHLDVTFNCFEMLQVLSNCNRSPSIYDRLKFSQKTMTIFLSLWNRQNNIILNEIDVFSVIKKMKRKFAILFRDRDELFAKCKYLENKLCYLFYKEECPERAV